MYEEIDPYSYFRVLSRRLNKSFHEISRDMSNLQRIRQPQIQNKSKCDICSRIDVPIWQSDISGKSVCVPCIVDITFKNYEAMSEKSKNRKINKDVNPKNNEVIIKK
jgi:hypothetical protein